mmetsp:Transcript_21859/g.74294  ORF Transcript_21859/g.74294 Transcript_21859/m.74294 type:complete len:200 (-) Transcript_21859:927-1526(-)
MKRNSVRTRSSVPSSSSSVLPLLPDRSLASTNFATSSAGRFCRELMNCSNESFSVLPNASDRPNAAATTSSIRDFIPSSVSTMSLSFSSSFTTASPALRMCCEKAALSASRAPTLARRAYMRSRSSSACASTSASNPFSSSAPACASSRRASTAATSGLRVAGSRHTAHRSASSASRASQCLRYSGTAVSWTRARPSSA